MFEPIKLEAMVQSTESMQEVFIVAMNNNNECRAVVGNKLCTAIYNPFTELFYVDDKYGVIDTIEEHNNGT